MFITTMKEAHNLNAEITAQELLEAAARELSNLHSGEVFLVKDLFKGYQWNRIPISTRLTLGTLFRNYAQQHAEQRQVVSKTSSGQQRYSLI